MALNVLEVLLDSSLKVCPYTLEIIDGKYGPFLALSGSRKGMKHKGGGVILGNFHFIDSLSSLIKKINEIETLPDNPLDPKEQYSIAYITERSRIITGEIKNFDDVWYYRIKAYNNFFTDPDTGEIKNYKENKLRPCGRGFFIQEFDLPLNKEGKLFAIKFANDLKKSISNYLNKKFNTENIANLISEYKLLINDELLWIDADPDKSPLVLNKSLLTIIIEQLLEDDFTPEQLAEKLNVSEKTIRLFLNITSRYDPRFLNEGVIINRLKSDYRNFKYQAIQIPPLTLTQSPLLDKLLDENIGDKWPSWKKVYFMSDEYSQGKRTSLQFAKFEVDSIANGAKCGVAIDINQIRTISLRLFDLQRSFEDQPKELDEVNQLVKQFNNALEGYLDE